MSDRIVPVTWQGPFVGETVNGGTLAPGDHFEIPEYQVHPDNGHFKKSGGKPKGEASSKSERGKDARS